MKHMNTSDKHKQIGRSQSLVERLLEIYADPDAENLIAILTNPRVRSVLPSENVDSDKPQPSKLLIGDDQ